MSNSNLHSIKDIVYDDFDDMHYDGPRPRPPCPYCSAPTEYMPDSYVYRGRTWGTEVLVCTRFPHCDAFVGCHQRSGMPKGTLANQDLRDWRKAAHMNFDPLWKTGLKHRVQAYMWLSIQLNISMDDCHIGMFDADRCQAAIKACQQWIKEHVDGPTPP